MKVFKLSEIKNHERRFKFRFKTQEELESEFGELSAVPGGWFDEMGALFGLKFSLPTEVSKFKLIIDTLESSLMCIIIREVFIPVRKGL